MMNRRQLLIGSGALAVAGASVSATAIGLRGMGSAASYDAAAAASRAALPQSPAFRDLIRFATLAASGHNAQPWRFRDSESGIRILPDFTRRTPIVDPDDHHLFVSLGCAAENLVLAAGARNRCCEARFDPTHQGSILFEVGNRRGAASPLFHAIARRQSTRTEYDGRALAPAALALLESAVAIAGVDVLLITARTQIDRIRELVIAANSDQMADDAFMRELKDWIRFNPRQAMDTADGLFSVASGSPSLPTHLGPLMLDLVLRAKSENEKYARQLDSSAGLAIFVSELADHDHWVRVGRACQRFALQATLLGLKVAFVNQPVEVARFRPELAALVGMPGRRPDLVMRFGNGPSLPFSARRPVNAVLA